MEGLDIKNSEGLDLSVLIYMIGEGLDLISIFYICLTIARLLRISVLITRSSLYFPVIQVRLIVFCFSYDLSRELHCLRHKIHIGLFITLIFADISWIFTACIQVRLL